MVAFFAFSGLARRRFAYATPNEHLVTKFASPNDRKLNQQVWSLVISAFALFPKSVCSLKWRLARHNDARVVPHVPSSTMSLVNFGEEYVYVERARDAQPKSRRDSPGRSSRRAPPREKSTAPSLDRL